MARVLLVDASPLIYATYAQVGHFCNSAKEPTGLRYGFIRSVRSYAEKTRSTKVVICYDTPGTPLKATGLSHYKADRTYSDGDKTMFEQIPELKAFLALTSYTQAEASGYEADDVIATLARKLKPQGHEVTIISPDNDLCQLLADGAEIWMPPKKADKAWLKDANYVREKFGVVPRALLAYRAAVGDTSDNLPGLPLDDKVKLQAFLNQLAARYTGPVDLDLVNAKLVNSDDAHLAGPPNVNCFIKNWKAYCENFALMTLAEVPTIQITKGKADREALTSYIERMEAMSLLKHVDSYLQPGLVI